jgi:aryl-alcohol dehydrogenase-like predicted oxidoreductase
MFDAMDMTHHLAAPDRQLGSTGLTVGRIGLGLAALGRPGYINSFRDCDLGTDRSVEALEARCHSVLDAAYDAGIRYLDAARSYGLAEQFLASWLERRALPPGAVVVGSKWGYTYTAQWRIDAPVHEIKELSLATLDRQISESRRILGEHLALYQIHSATVESGVLKDRHVLEALVRLRAGGLVIGLTVSGPTQSDTIRHALRLEVDGVNPFQVVQATWNLLEVSAGAALADAKAQGWGIIIKEVLANGRLTDRAVDDESAPPQREAAGRRVSLTALAMAAALWQPWADVVLSGAVTVGQLRENLAAQDAGPMTQGLEGLAVTPVEYWSRRNHLGWQ